MQYRVSSGFKAFSQGDWVVAGLSVAVKWLRVNLGDIKGLVHRTLVGMGRHGLGKIADPQTSPQGDRTSG